MNRQRRLRVVSEGDARLDQAVALVQHLVEEHPNEDVGPCSVADLCDPDWLHAIHDGIHASAPSAP